MKDPLRRARFLISETDPSRVPPAKAEVVLVGRSNVGKSSTLCALCDNRALARVSKTPGRTRGINIFETAKEHWIVDLPGYGFATGPQKEVNYWPEMISTYISGRPSIKLVLVLVDGELGVGPKDMDMIKWLRENTAASMLVGTKVDRMGGSRQMEYRKKMAGALGLGAHDIHWVSAKKGYGMDALRVEVIEALGV